MTLTQSFILGLIQGLTEFIPVSSSAHLALVPHLFGWEVQSTEFDILLHGGTLLALLFYFWSKIKSLLVGTLRKSKKESLVTKNIVVAAIPALFFGGVIVLINKLFDDKFDSFMKHEEVIVVMLILLGILFIGSDYYFKNNHKSLKRLSFKNNIIIGLGQSLAYIRGTSRSGATILAGLSQGLERRSAAEFAFLIGIPVIAVALVFDIVKLITDGGNGIEFETALVGFLTAFVSGLFAIRFMLRFLNKNGLKIFGIYRVILGVVIIITLL
jgi:undecaprenyl-diphosphatase